MEEVVQAATADQPQVSSFFTRLTNVFASPGELYSEVALAPVQTTSWLLPYLFSVVLTVFSVIVVTNNPALKQEIIEQQQQEMQVNVEKGRMTQEQAEQYMEGMESAGPAIFIVFGSIFGIVTLTATFYGVSAVLWLAAKSIFKTTVGYKKLLEVYGLSALIGILGSIITILMMIINDTMKTGLGGILVVGTEFDRHNFIHNLLASLNLPTIWQVAVLGIGLSKVSNKPTSTGMGVMFGLWGIWTLISSAMGWGFR
jgi:hypothetical protein